MRFARIKLFQSWTLLQKLHFKGKRNKKTAQPESAWSQKSYVDPIRENGNFFGETQIFETDVACGLCVVVSCYQNLKQPRSRFKFERMRLVNSDDSLFQLPFPAKRSEKSSSRSA